VSDEYDRRHEQVRTEYSRQSVLSLIDMDILDVLKKHRDLVSVKFNKVDRVMPFITSPAPFPLLPIHPSHMFLQSCVPIQ
jgi:hypothetical protein